MTNEQVKSLKPGTKIKVYFSGASTVGLKSRSVSHERPYVTTIKKVLTIDVCENPSSAAMGMPFAQVHVDALPNCTHTTELISLVSDEYLKATGFATHDSNGRRINGAELV